MRALNELVVVQAKSKVKAGEGLACGTYKFFTSSNIQSKWLNEYQYDKPALIFGTGGMPSIHYCETPFSTSTDCIVMYAKEGTNLQVIYRYLSANMHLLEEGFHGIGLQHISKKYLLDIEIPELDEANQEAVTEIANKIDVLISARRKQLAKLDQLVKSRFIELFGDPDTNPLGWNEDVLSEHLEVIGGYAFKSDKFVDKGIPVLRIGNINSGRFLPVNMVYWTDDPTLERYKMYPGDLVMSLTGTVGKDDYGNVCILGADHPEYYLNQRNAKLSLKPTLNAKYLSELLKFERIKRRLTGISRGVRQANISNKDILYLCVPIAPINLQQQFAAFVEQTDKSKLAIQQSLDKLELLKKSLMQEYFG